MQSRACIQIKRVCRVNYRMLTTAIIFNYIVKTKKMKTSLNNTEIKTFAVENLDYCLKGFTAPENLWKLLKKKIYGFCDTIYPQKHDTIIASETSKTLSILGSLSDDTNANILTSLGKLFMVYHSYSNGGKRLSQGFGKGTSAFCTYMQR